MAKVKQTKEQDILTLDDSVVTDTKEQDILTLDDSVATDTKEIKESIYLQYKIAAIRYIGEKERDFKEGLTRPFPKLKTGDIVIVDIKTANFLTRLTGGFEKIDLNNR